jgi:hypothetical protein
MSADGPIWLDEVYVVLPGGPHAAPETLVCRGS